MNKLNLAIASGMISVLMPVTVAFAASTDVMIDTTGAQSTNVAKVKHVCMTNVSQNNVSTVVNSVMIDQNTGNNSANANTGDGVVTTGDTVAAEAIDNAGNSNELDGTNCCCSETESTALVTVSNTGYQSVNRTSVKNVTKSTTRQRNVSSKVNSVGVGQNTGLNRSNRNTGNGGVSTGVVDVLVEVHNEGDSNTKSL